MLLPTSDKHVTPEQTQYPAEILSDIKEKAGVYAYPLKTQAQRNAI